MARRSQTPALTGANYRQFAALVLVGALGVALFGGSAEPASEPSAPPPPVAAPAPAAASEARDTGGEFFAAEAEASDFAPEEPIESEETAPPGDLAADDAKPPMPEPAGAKPPDTRPTPAQIARLIEASRERSGARPGGD
jgi:hypothetical protein